VLTLVGRSKMRLEMNMVDQETLWARREWRLLLLLMLRLMYALRTTSQAVSIPFSVT
jgi:hypothetical protein